MNKNRDGYKETEIGWLPEDWEVKELQKTAKVTAGQSPSSDTYNENGIGLPFYQGKTEFGDMYPVVRKWCSEPLKIAESLDILISVRAPVGDVNICQEKSCIGRGLASIRSNKYSDYMFLYYMIQHKNNDINKLAQGSTFTAINTKDLNGLKLPIPPLKEQQGIAEILSTTDNHIEKLDKIIEDYQLLKKGMMQKLLTEGIGHTEFKETVIGRIPKEWEVQKLNEVVDVRDGTHDSPKQQSEGIPLITSKNLKNGKIDLTELTYISKEDFLNISKRSKVDKGDIIFAMIGTIGNPVIMDLDFEYSIKNVALLKFNKTNIINIYVKNLIESNIIMSQLLKRKAGGVQKFIALGLIRDLAIPVPPLKEQKQIADILSSIDDRIEKYQHQREDYTQLKKALMGKLLTGKIRTIEMD